MKQKTGKMKDNIFSIEQEDVEDFTFNEKVVSVFPDMISRSVPGYENLVSMIGTISAKYAEAGTNIYDLGCSLGACSFAISANNPDFNGKIIAVDNSEPMICEFRNILQDTEPTAEIIPTLGDIREIEIKNASFAAMNLTLQFIDPEDRESVIENIFRGMNPNSAFILSEKITFDSETEEKTIHELLFNYKRCRGYSDIEVRQKREALENILIAETFEEHKKRLKSAGFSEVYQWFQDLNFISIIALK
jgi:tRNA (cmo5U34)-methyltransferase